MKFSHNTLRGWRFQPGKGGYHVTNAFVIRVVVVNNSAICRGQPARYSQLACYFASCLRKTMGQPEVFFIGQLRAPEQFRSREIGESQCTFWSYEKRQIGFS